MASGTSRQQSLPDASAASLRARIDALLAVHTTLTLATMEEDGSPAAAAVFYAHDEELNLYFLSEERTRHGRNLLQSPLVAGTIQADRQEWRSVKGLQLRGRATPASSGEIAHAAAVFVARYAFAGALLAGGGPEALMGPLAQARFWVFRPDWFRLIDNTVRFGYKQELLRTEAGWDAA